MVPTPPQNVAQPRSYKRGDVIFEAGSPATHVFLLQSGIVALSVQPAGQRLEIIHVAGGQIFGDEALHGVATRSCNAVANNDVSVIAIENPAAHELLSQASPLLKTLGRSMIEKQRHFSSEILSARMDASDPTPCPPEKITKLFAVLHHCARYTGTKKPDGTTTVVWPSFKKYCQRTFLESPIRLEQAVYILVNLGFARLEYIPCETDPDAPDELGFVHFNDLEVIRGFFEFFRKGSTAGEIDPVHQKILTAIEAWNKDGKVVVESGVTDAAA